MEHTLRISVSKEPASGGIVSCRHISVRERFLRFLLGDKQQLTVIVPGDSVRELAISEVKEELYMGKVKLLLDVIDDLRSLVDSLQAVADAVAENDASAETTTTNEPEEKGRTKAAAKKTTAKKSAKAEEKPLTLEEVRAVLAEKSRAGHTAEVKELLNKHGADKLSEIDPSEYPALLADAEVL